MSKNSSISSSNLDELRATLEEVLAQLANLAERVAGLEELASMGGGESAAAALAPMTAVQLPEVPPATSPVASAAGISEAEFLAISAALAAGWECMRTSARSALFAPAPGLNKAARPFKHRIG